MSKPEETQNVKLEHVQNQSYQIENAKKRKEKRYLENHGSLEGFKVKEYKKKLHKSDNKSKKHKK